MDYSRIRTFLFIIRKQCTVSERQLNIQYSVLKIADFQDVSVQRLLEQTIAFAGNAYAPYSDFKVSACVLLDTGEILKGTNVENASYPVCICAERTVLSHAISNYPKSKIKVMAIYVDKDLEAPVPPCGLCRQSLFEAETRQKSPIQLLLVAKNGTVYQFERSSDLLPLSFSSDFLES
jgi:cytidine deaminase